MAKTKTKTRKKADPERIITQEKTEFKSPTRDVGRYHDLKWGGGQVTIPQAMAKGLHLKNKDKVFIEYDPKEEIIKISKLNE